MRARVIVASAAVLVPLVAACGSGAGVKAAGTAGSAVSSTVASSKPSTPPSKATLVPANKNAPSVAPTDQAVAGDIPDTQVFVPYSPPSGGYTIKVPEGWARSTDGTATVFSDRFNAIRIEPLTVTDAPTVTSVTDTDLAAIAKTAKNFAAGKVSAVTRKAGTAILATYKMDGTSNGVTDKVVRLDVERYVFWRAGNAIVVTLSGAAGSDNVDPWKIVTDGFGWT